MFCCCCWPCLNELMIVLAGPVPPLGTTASLHRRRSPSLSLTLVVSPSFGLSCLGCSLHSFWLSLSLGVLSRFGAFPFALVAPIDDGGGLRGLWIVISVLVPSSYWLVLQCWGPFTELASPKGQLSFSVCLSLALKKCCGW